MKAIICCLVCLALPPSLHAATLTVDNNTAHPADFRTIQDAVDAAEVGDTILVAGSNNYYGGFTSTKRLNIKGERPNPLFPASGPATSSFNGLHPESKFLAISSSLTTRAMATRRR